MTQELPTQENPSQPLKVPPPNYLVWAILTTLFCCLPFGIVSIVFAAQVNSKFIAGDYAGAENSSKQARLWAWIAGGIGFVLIAIYLSWLFFLGGLAYFQSLQDAGSY